MRRSCFEWWKRRKEGRQREMRRRGAEATVDRGRIGGGMGVERTGVADGRVGRGVPVASMDGGEAKGGRYGEER